MLSTKNKARFMSVFVILAMLFSFANISPVAAQEPTCTTKGTPSISTDQSDYIPSSPVVISGGGFGCGVSLTVIVTWPNHVAYTGDGTGTVGSDTVTTDNLGEFSYNHIVTMEGTYTVTVTAQDGTLLATTTFTDATIPPASAGGYYINDGFPATSIIPGTTDIGIHCDDCFVGITLPFPVSLYGTTFTTARVTSNGILTFGSGSSAYSNQSLPTNIGGIELNTIYAFWDDLYTSYGHQGVRTAVSGSTPSRSFVVEWRSDYCCGGSGILTNFEIVFYEGQTYFDIIYGNLVSTRDRGDSATIGVQKSFSPVQYTQYSVNTASLSTGTRLRFSLNVSISPADWDFGTQNIGTTSTAKSFTLSNDDLVANLNIGMLSVSSEFNLINDLCSGQTIPPSGTCTFEVTFSPLSLGARTGLVSVPSNFPITINVTGTGYNAPPVIDILSVLADAGNLEALINLSDPENNPLNGTIKILSGAGIPTSVSFETLETPCGSTDSSQLSLNGGLIGATANNGTCTCTPPIDSATLTGPAIGANYNLASSNTWTFSRASGYTAWSRITVLYPDASTQSACLFDLTGSGCTTTYLCSGYQWGATGSASLAAATTVVASQAYTNSTLPSSLNTSTLAAGNYLLYGDTSDGFNSPVSDTEPFTLTNEPLLLINPPSNASPSVNANAGAPYSGNEGLAIAMSGATASDPDMDTLTNSWTVDSALCSFNDASLLNPTLTCSDNGSYTATLSVSDGVNPAVTSDAAAVTVNNANPSASLGNNGPINEGSSANVSFSGASDPSSIDSTSLHYAFDCNGGSLAASTYAGSGTNGLMSCSFADDGSYTVSGKIMDKDGGGNEYTTSVTVNNVAPTVTSLVAGAAMACGQSNSLTVNFNDPALANDTYTAVVNWGDASSTTHASMSSGFSASHAYALAGQYTVSVTVSDEDGGTSASSSATLTLNYTIVGGGILQPINQDNSSVFKFKSTIPVKIKAADCDGSFLGNLTISIALMQLNGNAPPTPINEVISTSAADTTGFMRFTGSPDNQYIYNLATKPLPDSSATYRITLTIMQTGQTVTVNFGLKP